MQDEKLLRILNATIKLFMRYGIKSVTMDDVATEIGISKKTLYVHFKDKKDLVLQAIRLYVETHKDCVEKAVEEGGNAIDQWFRIVLLVTRDMNEMKPTIYFDLKKYYPRAFQFFETFRNGEIHKTIEKNLILGKKEGLYRSDLNVEIVSKLYINMIPLTMDQELFPLANFPFRKVYFEVFRYHIRGISSPLGCQYMDTHYKNLENTPQSNEA